MKQFTVGLILGILISISCAAFAVNYARDIEPINDKIGEIFKTLDAMSLRLDALEEKECCCSGELPKNAE